MTELEPEPETDLNEKASDWLADLRVFLLEQAGFTELEPDDNRFLQRIRRGIDLFEDRAAKYAELSDRRTEFYAKHRIDIIDEQYLILKSFLYKPPD